MTDYVEYIQIDKYAKYIPYNDADTILIGDSYGINHMNDNGNGWMGWGKQIVESASNSAFISSYGGSGFFGGVRETFRKQLIDIEKYVKKPEKITKVIVIGGYNDVYKERSFEDLDVQMGQFVDEVNKNFPNANIIFMYVSKSLDSKMKNNLDKYEDIFCKSCENNGIIYDQESRDLLDDDSLIFQDITDANYGFHPNTDGNKVIAKYIENFLIR